LRWPRERLAAYQMHAARSILAHARSSVALYRDSLSGVDPSRLRSLDDLAALPTITKRDFRRAPLSARLADGVRPGRLLHLRSSGSTGEPFDIYRSFSEEVTMVLFARRLWRRLGLRRGDRWARLTGGGTSVPSGRLRLLRALRARVYEQLSCRDEPEQIVDALRRHAPTVINGYPGALALIAPLVAADRSGHIRPRLVITVGEVLTPGMRRAIEQGFHAEVREAYGSYETGLVGWSCVETGLVHVADDAVALEVIAEGRPSEVGEEGEVVVTALHSRTMPFVRYRIGDRAVRGPTPCPCGLPVSTLEEIRGRVVDHYRLPDGRLVHHYGLVMPAMLESGVREETARYQFVQERPDLFVLRVAPLEPARAGAIERVRAPLESRLGAGIELRIEIVDQLDFEPSGKFRIGHSKVIAPV